MEYWTEAGLPPSEFWECSPKEYAAIMRGYTRSLIRDHNNAVTAGFMQVRINREERPKSLTYYLVDVDNPNKPKPTDQLPASEGLKSVFAILASQAKQKLAQ